MLHLYKRISHINMIILIWSHWYDHIDMILFTYINWANVFPSFQSWKIVQRFNKYVASYWYENYYHINMTITQETCWPLERSFKTEVRVTEMLNLYKWIKWYQYDHIDMIISRWWYQYDHTSFLLNIWRIIQDFALFIGVNMIISKGSYQD